MATWKCESVVTRWCIFKLHAKWRHGQASLLDSQNKKQKTILLGHWFKLSFRHNGAKKCFRPTGRKSVQKTALKSVLVWILLFVLKQEAHHINDITNLTKLKLKIWDLVVTSNWNHWKNLNINESRISIRTSTWENSHFKWNF